MVKRGRLWIHWTTWHWDKTNNRYHTVISIAFHKDSLESIIIAAHIDFNENEQNMLKSLKTKTKIWLANKG